MKKLLLFIVYISWGFIVTAQSGKSGTNSSGVVNGGNPAFIILQPVNSTVCQGGTTLFRCWAIYAVNYQWELSSDGGTNWTILMSGPLYGQNTDLIINNASSFMSGYKYRCVFQDVFDAYTTSNIAILTVNNNTSTISSQPSNITLCEGATANFNIVMNAAQGDSLKYQWQSKSIADTVFTDMPGKTNSSLVLSTSVLMNNNKYRCIISCLCNAPLVSSEAQLTVNPFPVAGSDSIVTVPCPECTLDISGIYSSSGFTSAYWNTADPSAVSPGIYHFMVTNSAGCADTATVYVNRADSSLLYACKGSKALLNASSTGTNFQWQVNTGTGFVNISNTSYYSGTGTSTLLLSNIQSGFYEYKYRCIINGNFFSNPVTLKILSYWTGEHGTAWEDPTNWSPGSVPDTNTDVYLNSGRSNYPVVNVNTSCRSIYASPGAAIQVNSGKTLLINGKN